MKKKYLPIGKFRVYWLQGGEFELDAGTMFGVVPKVLWEKKFPAGADNHILLCNDLLLIDTGEARVVVDTGLGNKMTAKQRKIFRVTAQWRVLEELAALGLDRLDIDHVILTHCDFDHAGGVTLRNAKGKLELTFPRAVHHLQQAEWQDVLQPNSRSKHTYWPENLDLLGSAADLHLIEEDAVIVTGVSVQATGGHTAGHQAVWLDSEGEKALHLGDLLPNQAHFNSLWVTAFDNFPLDSVRSKEQLIPLAVSEKAWFTFYHDPFLSACRFNEKGEIVERFERQRLFA